MTTCAPMILSSIYTLINTCSLSSMIHLVQPMMDINDLDGYWRLEVSFSHRMIKLVILAEIHITACSNLSNVLLFWILLLTVGNLSPMLNRDSGSLLDRVDFKCISMGIIFSTNWNAVVLNLSLTKTISIGTVVIFNYNSI